jgi:tripartite-type tricarboxylate transporter receptor subunit TctC
MRQLLYGWTAALGALLGIFLASGAANAESAADFYKGKKLTIVVGSTAGGGYDAYARTLARYYGTHVPGEPNVIVQNMPGGGSLTSVLYLDASAAKDGTVMTTFNAGLITESVTNPGARKINFADVAWLGSVTRDIRICYTGAGTGIKTWADLARAKEVTLGATGLNSVSYNDVAMLHNLFKRNVRPILGYPGRTEVHLAIERGELDGECGSIAGLPENWLRDKKINVIAKLADVRTPEIPDGVPYIGTFTKSDDELEALKILTAANDVGRPFIVSKQVPADRLKTLRAAFDATMKDKGYLAISEKQGLPVNPVNGPDAEKLIAEIYKAPAAVAAKAKDYIK